MYLMRIGRRGAEKPAARIDDDSYVIGPYDDVIGLGRQRQHVLGPR